MSANDVSGPEIPEDLCERHKILERWIRGIGLTEDTPMPDEIGRLSELLLIERIATAESELALCKKRDQIKDIALMEAAKDCLNPEGTYGEAVKRIRLINEWLHIAEIELDARLKSASPRTEPIAGDQNG